LLVKAGVGRLSRVDGDSSVDSGVCFPFLDFLIIFALSTSDSFSRVRSASTSLFDAFSFVSTSFNFVSCSCIIFENSLGLPLGLSSSEPIDFLALVWIGSNALVAAAAAACLEASSAAFQNASSCSLRFFDKDLLSRVYSKHPIVASRSIFFCNFCSWTAKEARSSSIAFACLCSPAIYFSFSAFSDLI